MALQLAPWLQPPDYLKAIDSGAGLGIQLRQNDLREQENYQRARQQQAELQQSWAEKMLVNQRMREQNQMQLQQDRLLNEQRNNRPLTLSPGEAALNPLTGQPIYTNPNRPFAPQKEPATQFRTLKDGSVVGIKQDGTTQKIVDAPPEKPVQLNSEQLKDFKTLSLIEEELNRGPVVTPGTWRTSATTNFPTQLTTDDASRLQAYRRNQALLNGSTNSVPTAQPFSMQTNALVNPAGGTIKRFNINTGKLE